MGKKRFEDFGLDADLIEAISYMGFEYATPIQELAIPEVMNGSDLIACAQTGTGKTAAFLLPVMHRIIRSEHQIGSLIVVPTRELAIQIDKQIEAMSYLSGISSIAIYGGGDGTAWDIQKRALSEGIDIIVATPGKLIAHINMGYVNFARIKVLVLDEADRMLDIGFHDDILKIIKSLPEDRQSLLFSATMPDKIKRFASKILNEPKELSIAISKPAAGVLQAAYLVFDQYKIPLIEQLIADKPEYESIIIFSATKKNVQNITRALQKKGINAQSISSNLDQSAREEALLAFKSKQTRVLVATDVISRGIDIKGIHLVINYNVPSDAEDYVHRIGRTARADATGVAITLINEDDMYDFHKIEQLIEREVPKLPPLTFKGPKWSIARKKWHKGGRSTGKGRHKRKK